MQRRGDFGHCGFDAFGDQFQLAAQFLPVGGFNFGVAAERFAGFAKLVSVFQCPQQAGQVLFYSLTELVHFGLFAGDSRIKYCVLIAGPGSLQKIHHALGFTQNNHVVNH